MNTLSKWGISLSLALGLTTSLSVFSAQKLDSIAAIVNDDIVLQSDLTTRLMQVQQQLSKGNTAVPELAALTSQVLDQLIIENLQLQLAKTKGVHIADPSLDLAIERIAKSNQLSPAQLEQAITDNGESMVQFRAKIRQELTINEIQSTSVTRRIRISEHDVDRYLASNQGQQLADTEYEIGHILISLSAQPDAHELSIAQQKLDIINSALEQGTEFSSIAATHSNALNALEGGNLGWRKGSQLPELFAEPIKSMMVGEVSSPIRNDSGFHFISLINKRGVSIQTVAQTKANHLLILPNDIRSTSQAHTLINELHQRLVNGADFYDLARTFSDDANSAPSGGDLGWINQNQLPAVLQTPLDLLAIEELSQPIQSDNGWHLLQAVERRTKDVGQANLRFQAKEAIKQMKFANELENWLRKIRNQAYIEIR
ncbi:MAG: peptidyl-prolyl cis-trans isomerase SurA [Oceanospirillaceae bacterium]|jgi:peptidyl-prolyl cis-trans isomerase SurA